MSIKKNIEELLFNSGISGNRIANEAGVPQSTVSRFLTGESKLGNMKLDHAVTLNDYYIKLEEMKKMKEMVKRYEKVNLEYYQTDWEVLDELIYGAYKSANFVNVEALFIEKATYDVDGKEEIYYVLREMDVSEVAKVSARPENIAYAIETMSIENNDGEIVAAFENETDAIDYANENYTGMTIEYAAIKAKLSDIENDVEMITYGDEAIDADQFEELENEEYIYIEDKGNDEYEVYAATLDGNKIDDLFITKFKVKKGE